MGVRYEWADSNKIILDIILEQPWTWAEYNAVMAEIMPMLKNLNYPCATTVDSTNMGPLPRDDNFLSILLNVEHTMPDNLFASVIIAANYSIRTFMNILMKVRSRAARIALFTETLDEAHSQIYARYRELYPELAHKLQNQSTSK